MSLFFRAISNFTSLPAATAFPRYIEDAEKPYEFEGAKHPSSLINYEDLMKVLRSRRSIRRFKSEPVPKEDIEAILEAMRYAPSAMNAQSWKYIIITDPQEVEKLRESVIKMMKMARKALKIAKILKPILPKKLKKLVTELEVWDNDAKRNMKYLKRAEKNGKKNKSKKNNI